MNIKVKQPSVKLIIFVLMICTFSIGYTEYAVMGILTSIADDFHIHVSSAGMLVTAYAASVCLTDRNDFCSQTAEKTGAPRIDGHLRPRESNERFRA